VPNGDVVHSPREALIAEVAGLRTSAIDVRRRDQHSDLFLKEQPLSILQWISTAPQHRVDLDRCCPQLIAGFGRTVPKN
jgi:hypothetical protein